ncbi:hypothetical protein Q5752_005609 [Cryptotrichosporon argae]
MNLPHYPSYPSLRSLPSLPSLSAFSTLTIDDASSAVSLAPRKPSRAPPALAVVADEPHPPAPASDWTSSADSLRTPSPSSIDVGLPLEHLAPSSASLSEAKPKPPPRSPLRPRSMINLKGSPDVEAGTPESIRLVDDINVLAADVARFQNKIYELEELRHTVISGTQFTLLPPSPAQRLDALLTEVERALPVLREKVDAAVAAAFAYFGGGQQSVSEAANELGKEWQKAIAKYGMLKEEMKEDAWLVRFRATADQAEGMVDALQVSLHECTQYVGRILSSTTPIPMTALEHDLSIEHLRTMVRSHDRLRTTYEPSVTQILAMMDKSVTERSTKNGEALRRVGDMSARWASLQKQLQQLDAKIHLVIMQHDPAATSGGDIEMLDDDPYEPDVSFDFGPPPTAARQAYTVDAKRNGHAASNASSAASVSRKTTSNLTPDAARTIRRMPSKSPSNVSAATTRTPGDKPRWNVGTKPPPGAVATPAAAPPVTPLSKRAASYGAGGMLGLRDLGSPTSSGFGMPSGSRVAGAKGTPPGAQTPRSLSGRRLSTGPPSAYRAQTPTPRSRPVSRLSMSSASGAAASPLAGPAALKPFAPSKYDALDCEVQRVIDATAYAGFVARLDPPLKRGQRMRADEQWKGEFIFGAGERSTSVKLLELAARFGAGDKASRVKCMVRAAGAWQDLQMFLEAKKGGR